MNEKEAKNQLRKMLRSFTGGTILHLLGEIHGEMAGPDEKQCREIEATLFVVGLGIDAALPRQ